MDTTNWESHTGGQLLSPKADYPDYHTTLQLIREPDGEFWVSFDQSYPTRSSGSVSLDEVRDQAAKGEPIVVFFSDEYTNEGDDWPVEFDAAKVLAALGL